MKTRAYFDEERGSMWTRLWRAIHGPLDVTSSHERDAGWARLAELEAASQRLTDLEDLERRRTRSGDDR